MRSGASADGSVVYIYINQLYMCVYIYIHIQLNQLYMCVYIYIYPYTTEPFAEGPLLIPFFGLCNIYLYIYIYFY